MSSAALTRREIADAARDVVFGTRTAAGLDGVGPDLFGQSSARGQLAKHIYRQLRDGRHQFCGARRGQIPRPGKEPREHAIPTVRDAIVLRAVASAMAPVWGGMPVPLVGGRPGTVPILVVSDFFKRIGGRSGWLFRFDIQAAFASASFDTAMAMLSERTSRTDALKLVHQWRRRQGSRFPGLIEGQPVGPLMLAVMLAPTMLELEGMGDCLVYLDDGLVVVDDHRAAVEVRGLLEKRLGEHGLHLHPKKTTAHCLRGGDQAPSPWDFLGFQMRCGRPIPAASKCSKLVKNLVEMADNGANADRLASAIFGWAGYYATEGAEDVLRLLDRRILAHIGHLGPLPCLEDLSGTRATLGSKDLGAGGGTSTRARRVSRYNGYEDSGTGWKTKTNRQGRVYHSLRGRPTKQPGGARGTWPSLAPWGAILAVPFDSLSLSRGRARWTCAI